MGKIAEVVNAWANKEWVDADFQISEDASKATLKFTLKSDDFSYRVFYEVMESRDAVELFLYTPLTAPAAKRQAVAETVVRANGRHFGGRIDLDMNDGEIRYRYGIDIEGGQLSFEMLNNLLSLGVGMLDRYLPVISAVIYANVSPADAILQNSGDAPAKQKTPTPQPTQEAPQWLRIPGADLLQPWAQELRAACSAKSEEEWFDVGRAVVLVSAETHRCRDAIKRVAADAGMKYIDIEAQDVPELAPRAAFTKLAPAIIFLEPGVWLLDRQKADGDEQAAEMVQFQQRLVTWIGEFDARHPVVLCTSVVQLGDMADRIDGTGRFDRYFALPPVSLVTRGEEFIEHLGPERCAESLTAAPAKLGKLLDDQFARPERRDLALRYLRRLSRRVARPIEFLDLMHISTHGFGEEGVAQTGSEEIRRQEAAHEAGHAAMAILDSGGRNVPDYCSIVPGVGFKGIVAESIGYHQSLGDRTTYADFRHDIRISLAGRAAEELMFGPVRISNGASGDLENAWKRAMRAFARWGFAPQMETASASSSNLAVVVGDPTPSESAHVEALIRQFLSAEYATVLKCLADNEAFVKAIADRLLWDPIVDQAELTAICAAHLNHQVNSTTPATPAGARTEATST